MVKEISVEELLKMLDKGAELVDVRESEELPEGSIGGGKNWPLSSFGMRQSDISHTRPTIFYCRTGMRSMKAAEIAENWTNQDLFFLEGGFHSFSLRQDKNQESGRRSAKNS